MVSNNKLTLSKNNTFSASRSSGRIVIIDMLRFSIPRLRSMALACRGAPAAR